MYFIFVVLDGNYFGFMKKNGFKNYFSLCRKSIDILATVVLKCTVTIPKHMK